MSTLFAGDKKEERNNNDPHLGTSNDPDKMKPPCQGDDLEGQASSPPAEDHLFTTFSYNTSSKRLTMIPVKYKMKEERRKVLKISINKLKKIDDPESWLCRSVLINNTLKKLQKEARDEKMQKQMNTYSKTYFLKTTCSEDFSCQLNNNNQTNFSQSNAEVCQTKVDDQDCFYQKDFNKEKEDVFCQLSNSKTEEFHYQLNKTNETDEKYSNKGKPVKLLKMSSLDEVEDKLDTSLSNGVPLNEDFVEKIPSIKRCASRKRSLDEDGTASEILNLDDTDLDLSCNQKRTELDDVDDCDVHDVLSQLYMPPTPRMLTSMSSDHDDELNVVDIDSSYIDNIKTTECQNKLPNENLYETSLLPESSNLVDALSKVESNPGKRQSDDYDHCNPKKRRSNDDIFSCFNVCETNFLNGDFGKKETFDNFLYSNKNKETDRTSLDFSKMDQKESLVVKNQEEDELIELEDEEDIKRRLSQSLSSHYHRKNDKTCDNFFEDGCDNQYSCGHTVTMFNDIQSVTFHNLIASLET